MFDFPFPITCFDRMPSPARKHPSSGLSIFVASTLFFPPLFRNHNRNPPIDTLQSVSFAMLPHMSPSLFLLLISTIVLYFSLLFRVLRTMGRACAFPPSCVSHTLFVCLSELGRGPHPHHITCSWSLVPPCIVHP
ncbi:hypothetical protein EDD16DRAFT_1078997 [Pisolithus croceorrhizus]|nr:hypothetical protein EDD16DRAFT_1078997 [Pisolithus croceorrhizus]